jgi:hypothetical protein
MLHREGVQIQPADSFSLRADATNDFMGRFARFKGSKGRTGLARSIGAEIRFMARSALRREGVGIEASHSFVATENL